MKKKDETEPMKLVAKMVGGIILLTILLPTLIRSLHDLLLPLVVVAVVVIVGRLVCFHTRL